ncbi:hypothetical protein GCM10022384_25660 [Streptomyces marokkonensis]|uniref:Uncharacterized protein n=1 Tax=Streptomyces marokkonensis TaxID=324855 RepID=A0ABP7PZW4_9ACTN
MRFEVVAELGQPDVRQVGADAVFPQFQADVGGVEGTVQVPSGQPRCCEAAGADGSIARDCLVHFGHTGRGGSLGFADLEHGITFEYVTNHIMSGSDDVRAASLTEAVRKALA